MGTTWQGKDPWAVVEYKDINDAKAVWEFQNVDGQPKIQFGKRTLTIRYYNEYRSYP